MDLDKKDIINEIKTNPNLVFNLIVRNYSGSLFRIIKRMVIYEHDAEDVLQEVLIKVWKNFPRYKGNSKLFTWVYRIAVNESLMYLRSKKSKSWLTFENYNDILEKGIEDNPLINGTEIQLKLQKAILQLPVKQRMVFNMRYFEELPMKEIAQIMNVSEGGIKAQYHHAVKKIENFLNED